MANLRLFDGANDVAGRRLHSDHHGAAVGASAPVASGTALELAVDSYHLLHMAHGEMERVRERDNHTHGG